MPVALLLQKVFDAFKGGALGTPRLTGLAHWVELVRTEEVLIDRARGAFLVRWFGPGLPLQGRSLRAFIVNMDALRQRYLAVQRAVEPQPSGINLLEPLAGLGGVLVGTILSPTGVLAVVVLGIRKFPTWVRMLGGVIAGPIVTALGGFIGLLALPLAFVWGIAAGIQGDETLRAIYDVLGAVARLIQGFNRFIALLTGPRENIRNPILRGILEIFDGLARLIPFVLALFSVVVVRVGALVLPLTRQAIAFIDLYDAVVDTVKLMLEDLGDQLKGLAVGRNSPFEVLSRSFSTIGKAIKKVATTLKESAAKLAGVFSAWAGSLAPRVMAYLDLAKDALRDVFEKSLVGKAIKAFLMQVGLIKKLSGSFGPPPPPKPPSPPSAPFKGIPLLGIPPPPPAPGAPKLPSTAGVTAMVGGAPLIPLKGWSIELLAKLYPEFLLGEPFRLGPEAVAGLDLAREPASAFARQRRALEKELGMSPAKALAAAREQELPLRHAITDVVGRVFPPEIRAELPQLLDIFRALDKSLYETKPETKAGAFPVRDLPDNNRLRPVVQRLHFRHQGGYEPRVRAFRDTLTRLLREQQYVAPAEG